MRFRCVFLAIMITVVILGGVSCTTDIESDRAKITPELLFQELMFAQDSYLLSGDRMRSISSEDIVSEKTATERSDGIVNELKERAAGGGYTPGKPLIVLNPYGNSPLTAVIMFTTSKEYKAKVSVEGDSFDAEIGGETAAATEHIIPVIGLYPDRNNRVTVELTDMSGNVIEKHLYRIKTEPLPTELEDAAEREVRVDTSSYRLILVSGQESEYPYAFDRNGCVRWYLTEKSGEYGIFPISGGRFLVPSMLFEGTPNEWKQSAALYELDAMGRTYNIYYVENGFHHDIAEKSPGGNLILLTNTEEGYGFDCIAELDRNTGETVRSLTAADIFSKNNYDTGSDWVHFNSLSYVTEEDCIIVSAQNLNSVIKIDWNTGEIRWILSDENSFSGSEYAGLVLRGMEETVWNHGQSNAYQTRENLDEHTENIHIMLFDNHSTGAHNAFVNIYTVDEEKMTAVLLHRYNTGIIAPENSNCALDYADRRVFAMCGSGTEDGSERARIIEFDYETEEVIGAYTLKSSFYRAYEMPVSITDTEWAELEETNREKGRLKIPVEIAASTDTSWLEKIDFEHEGVELVLRGDMLFIDSEELMLERIALISDDARYIFGKRYGMAKKLAITLQCLKTGTYRVYLNSSGSWYDSGKTFFID